jgi:hypothetical protein
LLATFMSGAKIETVCFITVMVFGVLGRKNGCHFPCRQTPSQSLPEQNCKSGKTAVA